MSDQQALQVFTNLLRPALQEMAGRNFFAWLIMRLKERKTIAEQEDDQPLVSSLERLITNAQVELVRHPTEKGEKQ